MPASDKFWAAVETCRNQGDGVDSAGVHCTSAGSVQPRSAADLPREKVSTGASKTWEKRGYGNVLVRNTLGHMPLVEHGAVLALTPIEFRSCENDERVGGWRNPNRWVARTPSALALGLFTRHFTNLEFTITATRNGPGPSHRAPRVRAFLLPVCSSQVESCFAGQRWSHTQGAWLRR